MHFQYTCPTALQDAMSACALYSIKTEANQALVFGHVQQKCQQLVTSTDAQSASKTELLAALQSLVLYQMIRLFDGDVRLRALAEADESVTLQWANRLKILLRDGAVVRHNAASSPITRVGFHTSSSPSSPRDISVESSDNWQYWLTTESIRRTIITTHVLSGIYNFLKLGYDGPTPDLRVSFTAQTALWGAQSESGWRWAREDANVENLEIWVERWDEAIMKARPEDLEDMGVCVMVMLWGVEGARGWLGREFVARFGLDGM
jgi:DNA-binding HxlR family transcriptional regulator